MEKETKMNFEKRKTKTIIAAFLVLTFAVTLTALPFANAHTPPWTFHSYSYLSVSPNPIGVNQQAMVIFWLNVNPATASGAYGDRWTFTIEVTKPDKTNETLGPFTSDPVGGAFTYYTPTQVGTYYFQAIFPGHTYTGEPLAPDLSYYVYPDTLGYINDTVLPSKSAVMPLNVTEEQVQPWPETPLPTEYWSRPINDMNRNWAVLAGNWLSGAAQNVGATTDFAYGTGPESAHIMWTKPYWAGGIADARFGDIGYYQGNPYELIGLNPPIILNGVLYYNVHTPPREGWYAVDLYTGETSYFHNTTGPAPPRPYWDVTGYDSGAILGESLAFGQIYNYATPNQKGGLPYLWSTNGPTPNTWMMFDAFTGNYICSIANVSAGGTAVYGKDGSILRYNIVGAGANKRLTVWNTSQAIWYRDYYVYNSYWLWRPLLNWTFDGRYGFSLNASIPDVQGSIRAVREDQYVIGGTQGSNDEKGIVQGNLWALNLKPDNNGVITPTLLWNITFTPPSSAENKTLTMTVADPEDGVFIFQCTQTQQWWGYSLETGQLLWGPTEPQGPWMYYSSGTVFHVYQGMLITHGGPWAGGEMHAYNITTGKELWTYYAGTVGFETVYDNVPINVGCIADGKIYLYSNEHSPSQPLWRGSYLRSVNASNGVELWKISCWGNPLYSGSTSVAIADGNLIALNTYDNQLYCFGKGPSATTVTASPKVSVHGNSVLVEGTVIDTAAGTKQNEQAARFPNGVPAMSDADQQGWMEYLYEQQSMPTNAKGVEVTLDVLDPNGNFVHIDTVTSDASGMFKKAFVPEVPGEYTIIATFAGSKSYYGSHAETTINVDEAPLATPPIEIPQPFDYTLTIVGTGIVLLIAIAIVGILILRKRP
jgi:hypothetical protein